LGFAVPAALLALFAIVVDLVHIASMREKRGEKKGQREKASANLFDRKGSEEKVSGGKGF
jgi:hypothetical protein